MRILATLAILFALASTAATPCWAQEVQYIDSISVQMREITREEYDARIAATEHLRKPLTVIICKDELGWRRYNEGWDINFYPLSNPFREKAVSGNKLQRMLRGKLKVTGFPYEYEYEGKKYHSRDYEITFNDGTKRQLGGGEFEFVAYFPQLETLLFDSDGGDVVIELNNSFEEYELNPLRCAVSPDKQWRINGGSPDQIAEEGFRYYLEKWNGTNGRYEFVTELFGERVGFCAKWSWVSNDTVLYIPESYYTEEHEESYIEITIING